MKIATTQIPHQIHLTMAVMMTMSKHGPVDKPGTIPINHLR